MCSSSSSGAASPLQLSSVHSLHTGTLDTTVSLVTYVSATRGLVCPLWPPAYLRCTSRSPSGSGSPGLPGRRRCRRSCSRRACSGRTGTGRSAGAESTGRDCSDSSLASHPTEPFSKGGGMRSVEKCFRYRTHAAEEREDGWLKTVS